MTSCCLTGSIRKKGVRRSNFVYRQALEVAELWHCRVQAMLKAEESGDSRWVIRKMTRPRPFGQVPKDLLFRAGIQGRGRFVENDDRRVAHDDPCDGEPLALARREFATVLTEFRVVPVAHRADELVRTGDPGRRFDGCKNPYWTMDDPQGRTAEGSEHLGPDMQKEVLKAWFHRNFEDPAESTPHNSAEGGYQYVWGGPYDSDEELRSEFEPLGVPDEVIGQS